MTDTLYERFIAFLHKHPSNEEAAEAIGYDANELREFYTLILRARYDLPEHAPVDPAEIMLVESYIAGLQSGIYLAHVKAERDLERAATVSWS